MGTVRRVRAGQPSAHSSARAHSEKQPVTVGICSREVCLDTCCSPGEEHCSVARDKSRLEQKSEKSGDEKSGRNLGTDGTFTSFLWTTSVRKTGNPVDPQISQLASNEGEEPMPCAKTFSRTKTAFCSTLLYLLFALPLCAQAPPSADTFVSSAYPTTNFGSVNSLAVGPGSTSYVQFNLSGIPAGATVTKASLRLYVDLVSKAGKFDVYQVTKNWSEGSLNFNNQPLPLGGSLTGGAGISITNASCNQFLLIDVTSQVQSWLNSPDTNKGLALALVSGSTGNFFFDA